MREEEGGGPIQFSERQEKIIEIVRQSGPITSKKIAEKLKVRRGTLRPDLAILTMAGILEARPRIGYFFTGKTVNNLVADEIRRLQVKDIKPVPIVVNETTSVYDAVVIMFVEDVGTLFVVSEGGVLEGVVSRKDILKVALGQTNIHKIPVTVIMTRMPNIITITAEQTVYEAAKRMVEHEVDALPVVRKLANNGGEDKLEVIGRITKTNITKLFVELGEVN